MQGTKLVLSTAFHPQTNGQSEIVNKALEPFLRCFINGHPKQWAKWLSRTEFCYNTSPHSTIRMTPFQALYGKPPPHLVRFGHSHTEVDSLKYLLQERDAMLDQIQFNLTKGQQSLPMQNVGTSLLMKETLSCSNPNRTGKVVKIV